MQHAHSMLKGAHIKAGNKLLFILQHTLSCTLHGPMFCNFFLGHFCEISNTTSCQIRHPICLMAHIFFEKQLATYSFPQNRYFLCGWPKCKCFDFSPLPGHFPIAFGPLIRKMSKKAQKVDVLSLLKSILYLYYNRVLYSIHYSH